MGIIYYVRGLMDHPLYKTFYYDIYIEIKYKNHSEKLENCKIVAKFSTAKCTGNW